MAPDPLWKPGALATNRPMKRFRAPMGHSRLYLTTPIFPARSHGCSMLWLPPGITPRIIPREEPASGQQLDEAGTANGADGNDEAINGSSMEMDPVPEAADLDPGPSWLSETDSDDSADEDEELEAYRDHFPPDPTALKQFFSKFVFANIQHQTSKAARMAVWDCIDDNFELLKAAKAARPHHTSLPSFIALNKALEAKLPEVIIKCAHMRRSTGEIVYRKGKTFPKKLFRNKTKWALQYEYTRVATVKDIQRLHDRKMLGRPCSDHVILSIDDVPQDKSSGQSITVLSMRFRGCRCIFPVAIYKPTKYPKKQMTTRDIVMPAVKNILRNGLTIDFFVADAPFRAKLRAMVNHSGYYACDYCEAKGRHIGKVKYPASFLKRPKFRDPDEHRILVERLEAGELSLQRDKDELKGIKGRSCLLDIPGFDIVNGVPSDWMHLCAEGLFERTFELSMKVYEGKDKNKYCFRNDRVPIEIFNQECIYVRGPSDFSRRVRAMDYANFKAQEWRNLFIAYFPVMLRCLRSSKAMLEVMHVLVYIVRAHMEDDEHFKEVHPQSLRLVDLSKYFAGLYQRTFGRDNCTYNAHVFGHITKLRQLAPLTDTSAFPFESFYHQMKQSYALGTTSMCKQAILNVLMRIQEGGHSCKKPIIYKTKAASQSDDTLIFTEGHQMFQIRSMEDGGTLFRCSKIHKSDYTVMVNDGKTMLDFGQIGVYTYDGVEDYNPADLAAPNTMEVPKRDVQGKVVLVHGFLVTIPIHVLVEAW